MSTINEVKEITELLARQTLKEKEYNYLLSTLKERNDWHWTVDKEELITAIITKLLSLKNMFLLEELVQLGFKTNILQILSYSEDLDNSFCRTWLEKEYLDLKEAETKLFCLKALNNKIK